MKITQIWPLNHRIVSIMSSLKILIVDDTEEFSLNLKRLLESMGHSLKTAADSEAALKEFASAKFDLALVDCFIPGEDGFTISKKLNDVAAENQIPTKFCLMSGILTDEASKKEALNYSHITGFLQKPAAKEDLENLLADIFSELKTVNEEVLIKDYDGLKSFLTDLEKIKQLKGYEISLLLNKLSSLKFDGSLNFKQGEQETKLVMTDGVLHTTINQDYNGSIGEILVRLGYLTRENLSHYVSSEDFKTGKERIGMALIKHNFISPHSVPIALKEQKKLRVSHLISEKTFDFSFEHISSLKYDITSSLQKKEILAHCLSCLDKIPEKVFKDFTKEVFKNSQSLNKNEAVLNLAKKTQTPSELSSADIKKLISLYQQKEIKTEANNKCSKNKRNLGFLSETLEALSKKIESKNPYIILDISPQNASDQKVSQKYQALAKELHPDRITNKVDEATLERAKFIFSEITEAFNSIKTIENRQNFEEAQENTQAQTQINSDNILEQAKKDLHAGLYSKALEALDTKNMHNVYPNEFGLYFLWSALKTPNYSLKKDAAKILAHEHKNLKTESLYYYIKALLSLETQDLNSFKKFTDLSLSADPHFLPARREFQIVRSQKEKASASRKKSWFSFKKSS